MVRTYDRPIKQRPCAFYAVGIDATFRPFFFRVIEETPKTIGMASLVVYGAIVAHNIKEIVQHEREIKKQGSAE
jgi:hypothetical protein